LDLLDPSGDFIFQTFDYDKEAKRGYLARAFHGTLEEHTDSLNSINDQGGGVFVRPGPTWPRNLCPPLETVQQRPKGIEAPCRGRFKTKLRCQVNAGRCAVLRSDRGIGNSCQLQLLASACSGLLCCFSVPFHLLRHYTYFIYFGEDSVWVCWLLHCLRLRIVTLLDHGHIPSQFFE
jgi:hypothetical protein